MKDKKFHAFVHENFIEVSTDLCVCLFMHLYLEKKIRNQLAREKK